MSRVKNPLTFVILNEVKNLVPRVLLWGSVKSCGSALDEILTFVHNVMDGGVAFPYILALQQS
ncbi:MAG TPA: hypothetical protein VEW94_05420, partial [Chloroflexia bacterium]|nr:hypothetical protein [Chloroflexia bacterium]